MMDAPTIGTVKAWVNVSASARARVENVATMGAVSPAAAAPWARNALRAVSAKSLVWPLVRARLVVPTVVVGCAAARTMPIAMRIICVNACPAVNRPGNVVMMVVVGPAVIAVRAIHAMMHMCVSARILALETRTAMRMLIAQVRTTTVRRVRAMWNV